MTHPAYGPVELVIMTFPHEQLAPPIGDALVDLTEAGAVTVLDLIHVRRSAGGYLETFEIEGLGPSANLDVEGLTSRDDLEALERSLDPGTSALVLVVEHTWSRALFQAAESSGASLVTSERIPVAVVSSLVEQSVAPHEPPTWTAPEGPPSS